MLARRRPHTLRPPSVAGLRALRSTPPAQIGPLLAGLGVAGVLYGTRLLLQAAQNPKFQEAMRRGGGGDGSPDGDPEREPDPSRGRTDSGEPAPRRTAEQPSYFTTEVRDTSETLRASAHHFPSLPSRVLRRFVAATAVHRACPGDGLLSRRGLQGLVGRLRGRL